MRLLPVDLKKHINWINYPELECFLGDDEEKRSWWIEPRDIEKDYEKILQRIAGGEFQELKKEVERLNKDVKLLKGLKRILVTEEAFIEVWDNEYDELWDEY